MKRLRENLRKTRPYIEDSLFKCVDNINLEAVMGYKKNGVRYRFLDNYDEKDK